MRLPLRRRTATRKRRDEIVEHLRRSPMTARQLAERLGVTHNAVRGHLSALEREGLIRQAGLRAGTSRPSVVYALTAEAETSLSRAYVPFVAQLMRVLQQRLRPGEVDDIMCDVGRRLADAWPRPVGELGQRVQSASALLDQLGAPNEVQRTNGEYAIRGYGCLLAEAIHGRPDVCRAMESLLSELLNAPVRECCDRRERPRCCFEIGARARRRKRRTGRS